MDARDFDIIVYGATGFVGKRASRYLAAVAEKRQLRYAIAGRDRAKLEALASECGNVPVLIAEARDEAALAVLAARTRVVLAMAGPFSLYADALVTACVNARTHYADITGESPWVRTLIDKHHDRIGAEGTRIVPGCGFDSIPSDIGAFVTARYAQRALGDECGLVKAGFRMMGGVNGGTLASAMLALGDPQQAARMKDPQLLTPANRRKPNRAALHDPMLSRYDGDFHAWLAPFVMGPINTRVVRRSAALFEDWNESYGENFSYQEYLKFGGSLGAFGAGAVAAGTFAFETALGFPIMRRAITPLLPKPGEGPSEKAIESGFFKTELIGKTRGGKAIRTVFSDSGDPGNAVTAKVACESALALAFAGEGLPGGSMRGGILTPATALGDALVVRLVEAGMKLEVSAS